MTLLAAQGLWLLAMLLLLASSGFFSGSESALFSLSRRDRQSFERGNPAQRIAADLLRDPSRTLTAVLFFNLLINMAYFALAAKVSERLTAAGAHAGATLFHFGAILAVIIFGEMLPKSLAVLQARAIAALISVPLAATVRLVGPVVPVFRVVNELSVRLFLPGFRGEPYLDADDLERAVEQSTSDARLLEQERVVLHNILDLSEIQLEELMRPRVDLDAIRPPVSAEVFQQLPPSGSVLITEADSDEVASAIPLAEYSDLPAANWEKLAEDVVYLPWCATADRALEVFQQGQPTVVAVINEFGETIGIVTFDDILDTVLNESASRSSRLMNQTPIHEVSPGVWHVTGMTTLRRLAMQFGVDVTASKSVTVAGLMQEQLQRVPVAGDTCTWQGFELAVLDFGSQRMLTIEMRRTPATEEPSA